ncbi:MAG: hypothetical protein GX271_04975 [Clostridiales bacterium]|nr:hypothetical protein [Clostridiales bacterium]
MMKRGSIILIACILLSCILVGCKSEKSTEDSNNKYVTNKPEPTEAVPTEGAAESGSEVVDSQSQQEPNLSYSDNGSDPDIKDFSKLSNYFKDYDFAVTSNVNEDLYIKIYEVSGNYDLNGDGIKENIEAVLSNDYDVNSYVKVNDIIVEVYTDNPTGEVKIIDLDSNDSYLELAYFDDGPSGDPHYKFFRYNGEELIALGEMDINSIMDGRGRFISWFDLGVNFKPPFYTSWKELVDNEFIHRDHDLDQYIGKNYELCGSGYFVPLDKVSEDYYEYMTWDFETMRDFEATPIKILDIYNAKTIFIELEDGQKGLLYFWVGD